MTQRKNIHFIGIGGIGMSGIAHMFLAQGFQVQGSDLKDNEVLESLRQKGARIFIGHEGKNVEAADLVVYSSSIASSHVERVYARKKGITVIHRAQALAEVCRQKFTIAVAGTHGKTTTTSLVGMMLRQAGRNPSIVVGGVVNFFGGNACVGTGPEIVIEADESDSSFLRFSPDLEIITNIEAEHMEHFKSMERVEQAFRDFIGRMSYFGKWFGCAHEPIVTKLAQEAIRPCTLYAIKDEPDPAFEGIYATDIEECPDGRRGIAFNVWQADHLLGPLRLKIMGRHNALNALAAVAIGLELGIPFSVIRRALEKFEGAKRRFDVKFENDHYRVADDYGHHPTEIEKTLKAARALKAKRVVAVFQPHRYSRTQTFLNEFGKSFFDCDKLYVSDIYAASEKPIEGVSAQSLVQTIRLAGHKDVCYRPKQEILQALIDDLRDGDLVIVLGAGDIYQISDQLAQHLKAQHQDCAHIADERVAKKAVFESIEGKILIDELMSKHTTLRVGGPIDYWIEPKDEKDLQRVIRICKEKKLPAYLFGFGSNLLVSDEGIRGVGVHLSSDYFKKIIFNQNQVVVRAGVANSLFIQACLEKGLGGCEFLLGVPGNIGGAIAMNAGSHKQSLDTYIQSVTVMDWEGNFKTLDKNDIPFRYRYSGIKDPVIVEAVFELYSCQVQTAQDKLIEYGQYRQKTQDLQHPSAGCMFKNPYNHECSSGKLIEDAGLKGMRLGNAQISPKHANFIINLGGATCEDVLSLMRHAQRTVKEKFNVQLETEVKIL